MPISVGDYRHINELVGGHFDAVRKDFDPQVLIAHDEELARELVGNDPQPFTVVGYVHDEGLLIGLPVNPMASIVLQREIAGPCVLVSGTSPNGFYDGDNHDLPEWFATAVFQGGLHEVSEMLVHEATIQSEAFRLAYLDGLFTDEQAMRVALMMESGDSRYDEIIAKVLAISVAYATGRANGSIPKFDRDEFEDFQQSLTLTDDDIENFWEQEGK